ncbi:DUF6988 family protein [Geothrix campi]|uniref:DUF6988 family protein n=1 Tax=Geothrix campi TaxID=2966450 RepID=UPI003CC6A6BE
MQMSEEIVQAETIRQWVQQALSGREFARTSRSVLAAGCFDTVIEHQQGITLLLKEKLCGPAFSLARPVFETFVRGLWLSYCATEEDLNRFRRDKVKPTLSEIITALEILPQFSEGVLSRVKATGFDYMSSYTHGGFQQIVRRIGDDVLEPQYNDDEQIEITRSTTSYVLLAGIEIANLANDLPLAQSILDKTIEYAKRSA